MLDISNDIFLTHVENMTCLIIKYFFGSEARRVGEAVFGENIEYFDSC